MEERLPKRSEVDKELTWDLTPIYADEEAFDRDMEEAKKLAEDLGGFEGRVMKDAAALLETLRRYEALEEKVSCLSEYAMLRHDEDTGDSRGQELSGRVQMLQVLAAEHSAFVSPEILAAGEERARAFAEEEPGLHRYDVQLKDIFRLQDHSLPVEQEKLLAAAADMAQTGENAFSMLINADLKFPAVKDGEGKDVQITNGRFVPLQMSPDRELRRDVFEKFYGVYRDFANTWAALYEGQVKQQLFYARARRYGSAFEAAVSANNVAPEVCDNLIAAVRGRLGEMHEYVRLRKKLLGVDELHMYDVYTPMVADFDKKVTWEEAKAISLEALKPLGEDYIALLKEGYENRWIDVVENEGKRGGAYSAGVYHVHPYVLLNFNGTLDDVFTLVHEMGHSLHTWYSTHSQTFLNAQYRIFVAEVASTTNEVLLLEYLLERAGSEREKAYLINHYLENFKGTLFRQTMFEEFERKTNEMAAQGIPLTAQALCDVYLQLNRDYFGPDMVSDPLIAYEWCRIPHFYYNFYVYQYATSFAASVAIAHRILEDASAVEPYKAFLSSGCTQDPVSLLKIAGVDLSTREPIEEALDVFAQAIERMKALEL